MLEKINNKENKKCEFCTAKAEYIDESRDPNTGTDLSIYFCGPCAFNLGCTIITKSNKGYRF